MCHSLHQKNSLNKIDKSFSNEMHSKSNYNWILINSIEKSSNFTRHLFNTVNFSFTLRESDCVIQVEDINDAHEDHRKNNPYFFFLKNTSGVTHTWHTSKFFEQTSHPMNIRRLIFSSMFIYFLQSTLADIFFWKIKVERVNKHFICALLCVFWI